MVYKETLLTPESLIEVSFQNFRTPLKDVLNEVLNVSNVSL